MFQPLVKYDAKHMLHAAVGRYGASPQQLKKREAKLLAAKNAVFSEWKEGKQGWMGCPDDVAALRAVERVVRAKRRFSTCLVIGIGGSSLGIRAAYTALKHTGKGMELVFVGESTDPDDLVEKLSACDWDETVVNVITKSGDTLETCSVFLTVREILRKRFGSRAGDHIVLTTSAERGQLVELAKKEGYAILPIPQNIGGRFSILTAVGLFPLTCAGIDCAKLLAGAKKVREMSKKGTGDAASQFALQHFLAVTDRHQSIHVLMPYSARLEVLGQWYRQLWAESLGKEGKGPTPIAAIGPADQHSQIQLYMEGPADKVITFISVDSFHSSLRVSAPSEYAGVPFVKLLHAGRQGTAEALKQAKRPNGTIHIPSITPESIGALLMFFQIATAIMGHLSGINPYNQPGVQKGKKTTTVILSK